jgi:rubrerythrin
MVRSRKKMPKKRRVVTIIPPNVRGSGPYVWACIRCGQILPDFKEAVEADRWGCPCCHRKETIEKIRKDARLPGKPKQLNLF